MGALKAMTYILDAVGIALILISFLTGNGVAPWYAIGLGFILISTLLALYIARLEERRYIWEITITALLLAAIGASLWGFYR